MLSPRFRHSEDKTLPGGTNNPCHIHGKFPKYINDSNRFLKFKARKMGITAFTVCLKFIP